MEAKTLALCDSVFFAIECAFALSNCKFCKPHMPLKFHQDTRILALPPGSMPFTMAPFPSGRCVTIPKPGEASYKTCQSVNTASPMTCKTVTSLLLMQMHVLGRLEGVGTVLFHRCSLGCNHQPQPDCDEVAGISQEMTYLHT